MEQKEILILLNEAWTRKIPLRRENSELAQQIIVMQEQGYVSYNAVVVNKHHKPDEVIYMPETGNALTKAGEDELFKNEKVAEEKEKGVAQNDTPEKNPFNWLIIWRIGITIAALTALFLSIIK